MVRANVDGLAAAEGWEGVVEKLVLDFLPATGVVMRSRQAIRDTGCLGIVDGRVRLYLQPAQLFPIVANGHQW